MKHEPWTDSPSDPKRLLFARRVSPWPRRIILVALVLAALALLSGCAVTTTQRASDYGGANIQWAFGQTFPDGRCGEVITLDGGAYIMRFAGRPPTFADSLECLGHELLHVMGGKHE